MVDVATVTSKGQITLPAAIRRKLKLTKGSRVIFLEQEGRVQLLREEDVESYFAVFDRMREDAGWTRGDMEALVKEVKARLWRERHTVRR